MIRITVLLLVFALVVVTTQAGGYFSMFDLSNQNTHRDNFNKDSEAIFNKTVYSCYDHVLKDAIAVRKHEYRTELTQDYVTTFIFPVSHLQWTQLLSLEIIEIGLDNVLDKCNEAQTSYGDAVRFVWNTLATWPHFSEYPVPCDMDEQRFGVSMNSMNDWGATPRVHDKGKIFRPRAGHESIDAVVGRLNKKHEQEPGSFLYFALSVYLRSKSMLQIKSLVLRKCVIEDLDMITPLVAMQGLEGARRAGLNEQVGMLLQSIPIALTEDEYMTNIVPLRSCVWEESDSGTCFVDIGWWNGNELPVVARGCSEGNCLRPKQVRDYTNVPVVFEPGLHRNHTRIAWLCHGTFPGEWITLRWELGDIVLQIDHSTPICHDLNMPFTNYDEQHISPLTKYAAHFAGIVTRDEEKYDSTLSMSTHFTLGIRNIINQRCVHNMASCDETQDDAKSLLDVLFTIIIIDIIIIIGVTLAFGIWGMGSGAFGFSISFYICIIVDILILSFGAYNFLFAPILGSPSEMDRPNNILGVDGGTPMDRYPVPIDSQYSPIGEPIPVINEPKINKRSIYR